MSWLIDWWYKDDPLHQVDPSLRSFLEKQSPSQYAATAKSDAPDSQSYREQVGLSDPAAPKQQVPFDSKQESEQQHSTEQPLPAEALYQDGRYAHLWKSYQHQNDLEQAGKSDQEKLLDVIGAFKDTQASLGHAAMENCADEQWNLHDCFRSGGWSARMTMCRAENRKLNRCVDMQKKFLRALGYMTMTERAPEESERIQMHADSLYQRMLSHEKIADDAKAKGLPVPPLPSVMSEIPREPHPLPTQNILKERVTLESLPAEVRKNLTKKHLDGLKGEDLAIAKRELEHSLEMDAALVVGVAQRWTEDHKARMKRRGEGRESLDDKIFKHFDYRQYPTEEEDKK